MPLKLGISSNIEQGVRFVTEYQKQIPYAQKDALNEVGFNLRRKSVDDTKKLVDRPVPWIISSWRVRKSTIKNLTYAVHIEDEKRRLYFNQLIDGGKGVDRKIESIFRNRISSNQSASPSPYFKRNKYGNVSGIYYKNTYNLLDNNYASYLPSRGRRKSGVYQFKSKTGKPVPNGFRPLFTFPNKKNSGVILNLDRISNPVVVKYGDVFDKIYNKKIQIARNKIIQKF